MKESKMNEFSLLAFLSHVVTKLAPYQNGESAMIAPLFIAIAQRQGCTIRDLADELSVDRSAISRATRVLGDGMDKHGRKQIWPGHGLDKGVKAKASLDATKPHHQPRMHYYLTDRGQDIINEFHKELDRHMSFVPNPNIAE